MNTGLLIVFGVLLGIAFLFCGIEYLRDYLMRGEFEDGDGKVYSKKFSFNKTLDKKMKYFPNQNMVWLKVFMNFVLPALLIMHTYDFINDFFFGPVDAAIGMAASLPPFAKGLTYFMIGSILLVWAATLFATIFIRFIDKSSFVIVIIFSVAEILYFIPDFFAHLTTSITAIGFLILNIGYFVKRRELFWKSTRELKELYSLDD